MICVKCIKCEKDIFISCPAALKRKKTGLCKHCYNKSISENPVELHPCWKGGKTMRSGYIFVHNPSHPFCNNIGYMREHRLVMEKKITRYLQPNEIVHHLNGIKTDNRIENLVLVSSQSKHAKLHSRSDNFSEWNSKR